MTSEIKELKRVIEKGKLIELVLEIPIGIIKIVPNQIGYERDKGKTTVWIHQFACVISKHKDESHDPFDIYDIPWKKLAVFLDERDLISVGRQNLPWDVSISHTNEKRKLP